MSDKLEKLIDFLVWGDFSWPRSLAWMWFPVFAALAIPVIFPLMIVYEILLAAERK